MFSLMITSLSFPLVASEKIQSHKPAFAFGKWCILAAKGHFLSIVDFFTTLKKYFSQIDTDLDFSDLIVQVSSLSLSRVITLERLLSAMLCFRQSLKYFR